MGECKHVLGYWEGCHEAALIVRGWTSEAMLADLYNPHSGSEVFTYCPRCGERMV